MVASYHVPLLPATSLGGPQVVIGVLLVLVAIAAAADQHVRLLLALHRTVHGTWTRARRPRERRRLGLPSTPQFTRERTRGPGIDVDLDESNGDPSPDPSARHGAVGLGEPVPSVVKPLDASRGGEPDLPAGAGDPVRRRPPAPIVEPARSRRRSMASDDGPRGAVDPLALPRTPHARQAPPVEVPVDDIDEIEAAMHPSDEPSERIPDDGRATAEGASAPEGAPGVVTTPSSPVPGRLRPVSIDDVERPDEDDLEGPPPLDGDWLR